jgi:protein gp37
MSVESKIEWTDATWNPTRGCTEIAPGCAHCYAKTFAERFRGVPSHPYERGFDPRIAPDKLTEPLKWKKPRRIFVDSMSDLFHEAFEFDYIAACFGVMAAAWWHTHQVLTKRPDRAVEFFAWVEANHAKRYRHPEIIEHAACVAQEHGQQEAADALFSAANDRVGRNVWPLPNVWIGTSIANQTDADKNIPHLLQIPAVVRFLSAEPLLGPVDLAFCAPHVLDYDESNPAFVNAFSGMSYHPRTCMTAPPTEGTSRGIQWVIVGGESGPHARPCNVEWIRSVVAQCKAAGVPVFVKQLGARPTLQAPLLEEWPTARWGSDGLGTNMGRANLRDKKAGDMDEWPADLRVRQFPKGAA